MSQSLNLLSIYHNSSISNVKLPTTDKTGILDAALYDQLTLLETEPFVALNNLISLLSNKSIQQNIVISDPLFSHKLLNTCHSFPQLYVQVLKISEILSSHKNSLKLMDNRYFCQVLHYSFNFQNDLFISTCLSCLLSLSSHFSPEFDVPSFFVPNDLSVVLNFTTDVNHYVLTLKLLSNLYKSNYCKSKLYNIFIKIRERFFEFQHDTLFIQFLTAFTSFLLQVPTDTSHDLLLLDSEWSLQLIDVLLKHVGTSNTSKSIMIEFLTLLTLNDGCKYKILESCFFKETPIDRFFLELLSTSDQMLVLATLSLLSFLLEVKERRSLFTNVIVFLTKREAYYSLNPCLKSVYQRVVDAYKFKY
ncbi:hypothetical protein RCL1_003099 [Eukaryota sp. TZLM3-RCL]